MTSDNCIEFFGKASISYVIASQYSKLCCILAAYKVLENLDAIALPYPLKKVSMGTLGVVSHSLFPSIPVPHFLCPFFGRTIRTAVEDTVDFSSMTNTAAVTGMLAAFLEGPERSIPALSY